FVCGITSASMPAVRAISRPGASARLEMTTPIAAGSFASTNARRLLPRPEIRTPISGSDLVSTVLPCPDAGSTTTPVVGPNAHAASALLILDPRGDTSMPRRQRSASGPGFFHVLNRSVGREPLFQRPADYRAFLAVLNEGLARHPVRLIAYCLLSDHWQ